MTVSQESAFFIALGERISRLRKLKNVTQTQLAETLGVSQQTIQSYEVGRRRIQVDSLPSLAEVLGVSVEELIGLTPRQTRSKRGPAPRWQQQVEAIDQLPKPKQQFMAKMIDALIAQAQR
ncbi:MAG: helix-turn-helix domain-containing protein [Burkholderiales bacterium]|jgi:transcriptional regulator with XRE-family HTH domain|nr:helix-turn-helix domain-containing protein [Burkholderiales bacterium]